MRGEQAIFNLEIKKKSGLSINPDIHHSKVFSSGFLKPIFEPILKSNQPTGWNLVANIRLKLDFLNV